MQCARLGALLVLVGLAGCSHRLSVDILDAEMVRARSEVSASYGELHVSSGESFAVKDLWVEDPVVASDGTVHTLPDPSALPGILASETMGGGRYHLVEDPGAENTIPIVVVATGGIALLVTGILVLFDQYISANTDGDYTAPGYAAPAAIASGGTVVVGAVLFLFRDDLFVVEHGYVGSASFEERVPALGLAPWVGPLGSDAAGLGIRRSW